MVFIDSDPVTDEAETVTCKISAKGLDSMKFIIIGRNIDITEGLKSAVQEKLGKLERYFTPETEIHVTLSVEKTDRRLKSLFR